MGLPNSRWREARYPHATLEEMNMAQGGEEWSERESSSDPEAPPLPTWLPRVLTSSGH